MKLIFEGSPEEFSQIICDAPDTCDSLADNGKLTLSGTIAAINFDSFTLKCDFGCVVIYVENSAQSRLESFKVGDFIHVRVDFQLFVHELSIYYKLVAYSRTDFIGYMPKESGTDYDT